MIVSERHKKKRHFPDLGHYSDWAACSNNYFLDPIESSEYVEIRNDLAHTDFPDKVNDLVGAIKILKNWQNEIHKANSISELHATTRAFTNAGMTFEQLLALNKPDISNGGDRYFLIAESRKGISLENQKAVDLKSDLERAIDDAKEILNLEDDWNGEGAEQISPEIFDVASNFLRRYDSYLKETFKIDLLVPEINPCPNGTIDLSWRSPSARLLVNIKFIEGQYYAYFYGDRYNNKSPLKGNTQTEELSEGLAILMKSLYA